MLRFIFTRLIASSLFFVSFSLFAWNATGHMVIAEIAYSQLTPAARKNADNLLATFQKEYPDVKSFQELAAWPDTLHSQKIETYTRWHYIDNAFSTDGTPLQDLVDTDNAVWAVDNIDNIVKNTKANVNERARFLGFLIHIVGDLHQPLHTVSYISANHPDGDRGGNSYTIKYKNGSSNTINLHKLWDGAVGSFESDPNNQDIEETAQTLMALYPKSFFGDKVTDVKADDWAKEGMVNAKTYVYTTPENQAPTTAYLNTGKQIAQQEAALAGYRLAVLLNQFLA